MISQDTGLTGLRNMSSRDAVQEETLPEIIILSLVIKQDIVTLPDVASCYWCLCGHENVTGCENTLLVLVLLNVPHLLDDIMSF